MKKRIDKLLLILLNGLVLTKRGIFVFYKQIRPFLNKTISLYNKTIGFWIYKIYFYSTRRFFRFLAPWRQNFFELFAKRSTLQIVFFLVAFFIMFPYTKLYTKDSLETPGTDTVLYALVGPGDQDFYLEEVQADFNSTSRIDESPWRQGALRQQQPTATDGGPRVPQEIATLGAGGSALQKPTIISGDSVQQQAIKGSSQDSGNDRTEIVQYEVKPGDTIGRIAETFEVSVETILWANNLTSRSYIRPGDSLKILPTTGVLHKVAQGDTLGKIANKYDTEMEKIVKANYLQNDGSDIIVGEQLIIPDGRKASSIVSRPAAPSTALRNVAAPPPSVSVPAGTRYIWPTNVRRITQYYGWRHTGVDIAGPIGSPLYATKAGRVIKSQCGWNGGYGCHVRIDHGGGVVSLYAHASRLLVNVGQNVSQGQVIALMGSTGRSTGPHIHFEVRVNNRHRNPFSYVR